MVIMFCKPKLPRPDSEERVIKLHQVIEKYQQQVEKHETTIIQLKKAVVKYNDLVDSLLLRVARMEFICMIEPRTTVASVAKSLEFNHGTSTEKTLS
jgi:cell division protein FtsB